MTKQKVVYFQEVGQKRKMVIKTEFTPLSLSGLQIFLKLFIKGEMYKKCTKEHLELLRPWGAQSQLPGGPRFP